MNFAFNNLDDFMSMGHHGFYVWSAWLMTLLAIAFLIVQSRVVRRRFMRDELARFRLEQARTEQFKHESRQ
jgi:heme exporter protein D